MNNKIANWLTTAVFVLVTLIMAGAFVLSYDALRHVAGENGQPANLAYIWPLLIDAPLVVFTLGLLVAQITRQSNKFWVAMVILYTAGTIVFNLSHAPETVLGWLVAIVAPLGLLLTTEALRLLAKNLIERPAAVEAPRPAPVQVQQTTTVQLAVVEQPQPQPASATERVVNYYLANPEARTMPLDDLAAMFDTSTATVRRARKKVEAER